MNTHFDIIATVVTFNNPKPMLDDLQRSFFDTDLRVKLVFVDNSANQSIKALCDERNIEYINSGGNIGFGAAHNIGIRRFIDHCDYYIVLNPDVILDKNCLKKLKSFMDEKRSIPLCTPLILNPDRTVQFVNKRLPTINTLFARRFMKGPLSQLLKKELDLFSLQDQVPFNKPLVVPIISGCFMFFRSSMLKKLEGFDTRYFMYMEDFDISRRSSKLGPNVIYPEASIIHAWARDSHKKLKLTLIHIASVYRYFAKWGVLNNGPDSEVRYFNEK